MNKKWYTVFYENGTKKEIRDISNQDIIAKRINELKLKVAKWIATKEDKEELLLLK